MQNIIVRNVQVVNEGKIDVKDVWIKNGRFHQIENSISTNEKTEEIHGDHHFLIPGLIDDQVHFREPGLTHKADIHSESRAAVAGGVTSFMEMPNVVPPTLDIERLEEKMTIASRTSLANYSFFMGVANDNAKQALQINQHKNDICGLKIFMGSSTGNMLVDNIITLEKIFSESEVLIATHCESEPVIKHNLEQLRLQGIEPDQARYHPVLRDTEACYESSVSAIQLAKKFNSRLHILHISTEKELQLFTNLFPLEEKRITSEVCVHHLTFSSDDYETKGNLIKCNPAIKAKENREALWAALLDDRLDIIATDHAPHTWEEKQQPYMKAPAGLPLVQHSLYLLLDAVEQKRITIERVVEKACHAPARCFQLAERGYIREGYFADAVLINPNEEYTVSKNNLLYKCGWSPLEGKTFSSKIMKTFVNGNLVFDQNEVKEIACGMRLRFNRG